MFIFITKSHTDYYTYLLKKYQRKKDIDKYISYLFAFKNHLMVSTLNSAFIINSGERSINNFVGTICEYHA